MKVFKWLFYLALIVGVAIYAENRDKEPSDSGYLSESVAESAESLPLELGTALTEFPDESLIWGYHQLTPQEQEMYILLRDGAAAYYQGSIPCSVSMDGLERVVEALSGDHPELFWFNGGIRYTYPSSGSIEYPESVELIYIMEQELIPGYQDVVRRYVETCMLDGGVSAAQTEFEKIKAVYDYITGHTVYVEEKDDQSVITLMTEGKAVCAGYADAFQLIMHHIGLPCYSVSGHSFTEDGLSELGHRWNTVQCDGLWYNVDATWDDPVTKDADGNLVEQEGSHHDYLLVNDTLFYRDHAATNILGAPVCSSMELNYHNYYYLLYSTWDEATYRWAVETQRGYGLSWAQVRYDNYEAYYAAKYRLLDGGLMGDLIWELGIGQPQDDGSLSYTYNCNDETGVISLKLIY